MPSENVLKFTQGSKAGGTGKLSKWLHYFTTARGKKFSYRFMGAMGVGISAVFVSYQTYFIEYYIDFVRAYRNGLPLEVPEEMELLVDAAADRLKLPVRQATYLKSFMVSGFDVTTCGSLNSTYGGWVGIPINYLYDSTRDIDRFNIKLRTESIDWSSDHGKLLEKSIVLSEDEKMFGILRSILELQNYNHIHTTLVPSVTIFGLYVSAQTLNNKYNLFKLPQVARGLVYCCLSIFAYGIYSFTTDTIKIQQTSKVDKALAALGSDVIEAGIRFYDKILNKNVALRGLSGKDLYSVRGNEYPGLLRYNMFPLTTRKLFFQQKLEEVHKNEAAEKNNTAKETNSNQQTQNKPE